MLQTTRVEAFLDQVLAELQREDVPRDMDSCIDCWTQGLQGAVAMQSERWLNEARAAWPGKKRIKEFTGLRKIVLKGVDLYVTNVILPIKGAREHPFHILSS